MSALRYSAGGIGAPERVISQPTTGGAGATKIFCVPLFTCSCVLIAAASGGTPEARKRGPKRRLKPKLWRKPERIAPIVDEFFDSYLRWREASEDLRTAYEHWGSCEPSQRIFEFERYRAALDREERAARVHSQLAERLDASGAAG